MVVFIYSRINDIDHLVPIAERLQQDRSIDVKFISRALTPNFDFEKTLAFQASNLSSGDFDNTFKYFICRGLYLRLLFACFSTDRSGLFRKLQGRLFKFITEKFFIDWASNRDTWAPLQQATAFVVDHQISPDRWPDSEFIAFARKEKIPIFLVPHSFWHLSNGLPEFRRQYEGLNWLQGEYLIANSECWLSDLEEFWRVGSQEIKRPAPYF